jgi:sigma-B regulation protein RsbU (phosphoserine phosphatase)
MKINSSHFNQREIYKLVEELTTGSFESEIDFLNTLVTNIVDHDGFRIIGGRIWELDSESKTYSLRFQYGSVKKIPDDYTVNIESHPVLSELHLTRSTVSTEDDPVLRDVGIFTYSITGVGHIYKIKDKKFYKYVIGFNAPEIQKSFFETLNIISSIATITINDIQDKIKQKKINKDLLKAAEIQKELLPEHNMEFHDYKLFGLCIPDSEVGGDYFDFLHNMDDEEERLGVLISDAASKGLSAAIQALFVSGAIKMAMNFSPKISSLLSKLNNLIYDTFPYERFVTLFYCELSLSSNRLVLYANAGHCEPIHYSPVTDSFTFLESTGGLLGIIQNQKFLVENIRMKPSDILVLYTDGINEAQNDKGEFYGEERMMQIIKNEKHRTPKEIAYLIIEDVQKFSAKSSAYTDDKTLVVIKRDDAE